MVITGIAGFFSRSSLAISGALDGEMAMAARSGLVRRSSTIWISPASSALEAGPV
jgi:hypothetical protein